MVCGFFSISGDCSNKIRILHLINANEKDLFANNNYIESEKILKMTEEIKLVYLNNHS